MIKKTIITEQIELTEKYLETLKALAELIDDSGETKRGFNVSGLRSRKASNELGKTLVAFRKAFSATEE